ncbi:MAG: competence protein CoiA family protein [Bacteroidia bacterium]|nr:competence protein CoiA family protein [Bacteroidia bacterium]
MEYALYKGLRTAAQPTLKALCEHCGGSVIAKCGTKKIWHWAHASAEACDAWYEPETQWHRDWKHVFGEGYSEIRVVKDGTYHIADVINKDGIVFEFQNSAISAEVIAAREAFYGEKMIWVINGEAFKGNFVIYDDEFISDWNAQVLIEFDTAINYRQFRDGLVIEDWRVKQEEVKQILKQYAFFYLPEAGVYYKPMVGAAKRKALEQQIFEKIFLLYEQQKKPQDSIKGRFAWAHARHSWQDAQRPVFIDFGDDELYWITEGMGKEQGRGLKMKKEKFVGRYV